MLITKNTKQNIPRLVFSPSEATEHWYCYPAQMPLLQMHVSCTDDGRESAADPPVQRLSDILLLKRKVSQVCVWQRWISFYMHANTALAGANDPSF